VKDHNLGKAPTFAAFFKLPTLFFCCFSTRFFFSSFLCAKGSTPGSAINELPVRSVLGDKSALGHASNNEYHR
jgi:hypothetical protein